MGENIWSKKNSKGISYLEIYTQKNSKEISKQEIYHKKKLKGDIIIKNI